MNDLEIITVEDLENLDECLKIRDIVFSKEQGVPKKIEVDNYDSLNDSCTHFLIKYKNKAVGTLRVLNISENEIKLQRYCFLEEYRNLGLGKDPLKYIEDYYNKKNKEIIKLDAQYHAHEFYKKCGYIDNSDIFIEANIKHIEMYKKLNK